MICTMLREGEVLKERYSIDRLLGKGAYGTVYLARDTQLNQAVWAVKEILEGDLELDEQQEALLRFEREAAILKNLNHPGLPKVVDFFTIGSGHYLVMEYIEGKSFEDFCREHDGVVKQGEILPWIAKIADILEYLHSQSPPVIFRDLKPANIIITTGGRVKLVDFGIARHFDPAKEHDTSNLGTPGFCAPEQYGKGQSDPRTDIYSIGTTLYFALSGQDMAPFNFNFPPLYDYNSTVTPKFNETVLKCLAIEQKDRFQTLRELKEALIEARAAARKPAGKNVRSVSPNIRALENMVRSPWLRYSYAALFLLMFASAFFVFLPPTRTVAFMTVCFSIMAIALLSIGIFFYLGFLALREICKVSTVYAIVQGSQQGTSFRDAHRIFWVAMVIVALLLIIIVGPIYFISSLDKGVPQKLEKCEKNLKSLGTTLELYRLDDGDYPHDLRTLVPKYIKELPRCPQHQHGDYGYEVSPSLDAYTLICRGLNHGRQVPCDHPRYDSTRGLESR
jgi:hypothetical protein